MFKNAIVRRPGKSLLAGITSAQLGKPDYEKALLQHDLYIQALEHCDVKVTVLPAAEEYPDSVFVEDTAVLAERCAVVTFPGATSRQGEEQVIQQALKNFYDEIHHIHSPGTLEGGDVMRTGDHFYVGLSARTNEDGFQQFCEILKPFGYTASSIQMEKFLHLKTGLAYLENNNLLVAGEFIQNPQFAGFKRIFIAETENYAANCIWVNGTVLVPLGYPMTQRAIEKAGYRVITIDVSEFRKLDGGLSCLSLRF